ncbi:MAG TPA: hypothetical protein GX513_14705 [Firmicutes bacterium]|nr:hypothetical protein [Bacillota bacterium]
MAGLFGKDQALQVVAVLQRGGCPRIDGLVTVSGFAHLQRLLRNMASARGHGEQARPPGRAILFRDPVQLLSAGEPTRVLRELDLMRAAGVESRVTGGPLLLAVCVNPFYPVRLPSGHFQAAFIDAELLRRTVAEALGQAATAANAPGMVPPVLDVRREGGAALCRAVMKQLGHGTAALA